MFKKIFSTLLATLILTCNLCFAGGYNLSLKYTLGGADSIYYIPESYYASPIVCDIDNNGTKEIIFGNYSVSCLNGATGDIIWKVNGGKDRTTPYKTGNDIGMVCDIEVCDIDSDGFKEIIVAHANGYVSCLTFDGYMKPGWPQKLYGARGPVNDFARSLEVADLNNDGLYEIMVGASTRSSENIWVFNYNGTLRPGWPQLASYQDALLTYDLKSGYSYGVFMDGVTSGDINDDGLKEVIVATDTAYICAYDINGKLVPANNNKYQGRTWGKIAMWQDVTTELDMNNNEGWGWDIKGGEPAKYLIKGELGHAVLKVCDINNDGKNEVATSAVIVDRANDVNRNTGDYISSRSMGLYIFNGDRTRMENWEHTPDYYGLMGKYSVHNSETLSSGVQAEPVIADLDNDGINEIIINTYDSKIHAFSANNSSKEFMNFPCYLGGYNGVFHNGTGVVAKDITGDGKKEIIFATMTDNYDHSKNTGVKGKIVILNYDGTLLTEIPVADGYKVYETQKPGFTNSTFAKPKVEDIDNDGEYEVIVNTRFSGITVYDILGSTTRAYSEPNKTTILIDGKVVNTDAYMINGYNYFKLRDVAALLKNTNAKFSVGYNPKTNDVILNKKRDYTVTGGELMPKGSNPKWAYESNCKILNDNAVTCYTPYMIDGNNYFKLRDICNMANAHIYWNEEEQVIDISTRD